MLRMNVVTGPSWDFTTNSKLYLAWYYHVVDDIIQEDEEAAVRHPDNLVDQRASQERLGLADTETSRVAGWL